MTFKEVFLIFNKVQRPLVKGLSRNLSLAPITIFLALLPFLTTDISRAWHFVNFSKKTGHLPNDSVTSLTLSGQDSVWIGTMEGLVRFDGQKTEIYQKDKENQRRKIGLRDDFIWCLITEPGIGNAEKLWIGTGSGLYSYDGFSFIPFDKNYFDSLKSSVNSTSGITAAPRTIAIIDQPFSGIWLGGPEGIFRYDGTVWWKVPLPIRPGCIPTGFARNNDALWISTSGSGLIALFASGQYKSWQAKEGLLSDNISSLLARKNGEIWAGTDKGINIFRDDRWEALTTANNASLGRVNTMIEDKNNSVWVGTDNGLYRWTGVNWHYFSTRYGNMPSNRIWALLELPTQDPDLLQILVGTADKGLTRFHGFINEEMDALADLRLQAHSELDQQSWQKAGALFRQILEYLPDDADALTALGRIHLAQGNWRIALDSFLAAMEKEPKDAQNFVYAADALKNLGRGQQTLAMLKTAALLAPGQIEILLALAEAYLQWGELSLAANIFSRILEGDDTIIQAYRGIISCYEKLGLFFNAISFGERMKNKYPRDEKLSVILSGLYLQQGLILEATTEATRALEFAPNNGDLHRIMGQIYIEQELLEQAHNELTLAIKLNPGDAEAHSDLAIIYYRQREYEMMEDALDRALGLDRLNAKAYFVKGQRAYDDKRWEDAMAYLENSVTLDPKNAWAHYRLATAYQYLQYLESSLLEYQKVLFIRPDFIEASKVREAISLLENR